MPATAPFSKTFVSLSLAVALFAAAPAAGQTMGTADHGDHAGDLSTDAFARAAAESGLAQLMASYLALQEATGEGPAEDFAWTMINHHGSAIGDLAQSLSDGSDALPMEPSAEQVQEVERLGRLEGEAFDQAYFDHQVEAHRAAVALYEAGSRVDDEAVAQYAMTTLPVLRAHLEIAEMKRAKVRDGQDG